jgi:uncharacterized membrane protein YphA (DoxX/SURF4 family)
LPPAWQQFWFRPEPTSTVAVVRIVYSLLVLAWATTLSFDAATFFSPSGILPERPRPPGSWSVLDLMGSDAAVALLIALLIWAAACLLVGFHTRLAAVVVFVAMVSLHRRNPYVFQAGDNLLRSFSFYFLFVPAGAALSVDRWRRARERFWEFPARSVWGLRLIQVQLSVLYLFSSWEKVRGTTWNNGTAVSFALRIDELTRLELPASFTESLLVSNVLTFGTLAIEAALVLLVWNRRARPWVLAAGVALHQFIEVTMRVGFFSLVVFLYYLAFVPPDTMRDKLTAIRDRLRGSPLSRHRPSPATPPKEGRTQPGLALPEPVPHLAAGATLERRP